MADEDSRAGGSTGPGSGTAPQTPAPERSPSFANAYAVAYRLLGDRDLATEVAAAMAVHHGGRESQPAPTWLPDLAHDAVVASLESASTHPEEVDAADESSTRGALRRRLVGADPASRVAVALHHLAGYTIDDTAALMGYAPKAVEQRCRGYEAAPGMNWADLGDPLTRGARAVKRDREDRRRIPVFALVVVAIVLAIGIWAATSIGQRPTLDDEADPADGSGSGQTESDGPPPSEDSSGTSFSVSLDPLPGAGCAVPGGGGSEAGSTDRELTIGDTTISYRLTVPAAGGPSPLVVAIPDADQDPSVFQETAKLEETLPEAIHATLSPANAETPVTGTSIVPALVEKLIADQCVDLARVTVVGYGTGGPGAADAACELPDVVSGAAMVAGYRSPDRCELEPKVSLLISARDDDPSVDSGTALEEVGNSWSEVVDADSDEVEGTDEETLVRTWVGPGGVEVRTVSRVRGGHGWGVADTNDVVGFIARTARRTR